MTPAQEARLAIREGRHTGPTRGLAPGFVQIAHAPGHAFVTDLEADRCRLP